MQRVMSEDVLSDHHVSTTVPFIMSVDCNANKTGSKKKKLRWLHMGQLKLALQVPTVDLTQIPTQLVTKLLLHSRRGMISYHGKAPLQSKVRRFLQQHLKPERQTQQCAAAQMDRYTIQVPALIAGIRCYVDASLLPDQPAMPRRSAGLGVFFVNPQVQPTQTVYIRARVSGVHSVLMAEAAALALAATISDLLNFNNTTFLSDCQQLVHFLNAVDQSYPLDWRIKSFTQMFPNRLGRRQAKICKINRNLNATADALARQAFSAFVPHD